MLWFQNGTIMESYRSLLIPSTLIFGLELTVIYRLRKPSWLAISQPLVTAGMR
jgi:hypothetical protein